MRKNPTIKDRNVVEALAHAEKKRMELPLVVQVWPSDWDLCVLADEVYRLRRRVEELEKPRDILKIDRHFSPAKGTPALRRSRA
jgi:hypothetical protein